MHYWLFVWYDNGKLGDDAADREKAAGFYPHRRRDESAAMNKRMKLLLSAILTAVLLSACTEIKQLPTGTGATETTTLPLQTDVPADPTEIADGLLFKEAGDGTCSVAGAGSYREADWSFRIASQMWKLRRSASVQR